MNVWNLRLDFLFISLSLTWISSSTASSASFPSSSGASQAGKIRCNEPDRFVSASPLAIAAVCADGIALLAIHSIVAQEQLLVPSNYHTKSSETNANEYTKKEEFPDLPVTHRGPSRIEKLDGVGSCLISAGWMTDCTTLAKKCRSLAAAQLARYGEGTLEDDDYGRILAEGGASWMAHCAFSDNVRALSCVGLLASCSSSKGFILLVDATGAYRVRAHAIGLGANIINKRLTKIDFSNLSKEEGAQRLLNVVTEEGKGEHSAWSLPPKTMVEIAVIDSDKRLMRRLRQPLPQS